VQRGGVVLGGGADDRRKDLRLVRVKVRVSVRVSVRARVRVRVRDPTGS